MLLETLLPGEPGPGATGTVLWQRNNETQVPRETGPVTGSTGSTGCRSLEEILRLYEKHRIQVPGKPGSGTAGTGRSRPECNGYRENQARAQRAPKAAASIAERTASTGAGT